MTEIMDTLCGRKILEETFKLIIAIGLDNAGKTTILKKLSEEGT